MTEPFTLLYVSQAAPEFRPTPGISDIVTTSVAWNRSVRITGALLYSAGFFSQYLEGAEKDVCELIERIKGDPRHSGLTVVQRGMRPKRLFPHWSLAFAGDVGFVNNEVSRLFDRVLERRSVARASSRVLRLMADFVKARETLHPTTH